MLAYGSDALQLVFLLIFLKFSSILQQMLPVCCQLMGECWSHSRSHQAESQGSHSSTPSFLKWLGLDLPNNKHSEQIWIYCSSAFVFFFNWIFCWLRFLNFQFRKWRSLLKNLMQKGFICQDGMREISLKTNLIRQNISNNCLDSFGKENTFAS